MHDVIWFQQYTSGNTAVFTVHPQIRRLPSFWEIRTGHTLKNLVLRLDPQPLIQVVPSSPLAGLHAFQSYRWVVQTCLCRACLLVALTLGAAVSAVIAFSSATLKVRAVSDSNCLCRAGSCTPHTCHSHDMSVENLLLHLTVLIDRPIELITPWNQTV